MRPWQKALVSELSYQCGERFVAHAASPAPTRATEDGAPHRTQRHAGFIHEDEDRQGQIALLVRCEHIRDERLRLQR